MSTTKSDPRHIGQLQCKSEFEGGSVDMNVILIIVDTLRQDHLGCYGNKWIQTPSFDLFAKESIRFTRAYPDLLPTLPARRALYTGIRGFPVKDSYETKGDFTGAAGWRSIPEEQDTISELLQESGCRTSLIADVYHLFKPSKNFHRGFDQWEWIRGQEWDPYKSGPAINADLLQRHVPDSIRGAAADREIFLAKALRNAAKYQHEEDTFPARVFRSAGRWIEENQDAHPFFLTVESFDPHEPNIIPEYYRRLYDQSGDEVIDLNFSYYGPADLVKPGELKRLRANYAGNVSLVDRWFGYFMNTLRFTGRLNDTAVIVVSDHGHCHGEHNIVAKTGYPMTREIADLVLMIRLPDRQGAGVVCDEFVYHHDIPAIILALMKQNIPPEMNGKNILPAILEKKPLNRDHVTIGWGPFVVVRDERWWLNDYLWGKRPLLWDLKTDPRQNHNVAEKYPEECKRLLAMALEDAGGEIPEILRKTSTQPGCTPLGALIPAKEFPNGLIKI